MKIRGFHRHMATGPQSLLLDVVGGSPFLGLNQWHRQWRAARHYCLQRRHQFCFLCCFKRDWNWWCHYDFTISLWFHQHFFRTCSELSWMWFIPLQWILSKFNDHWVAILAITYLSLDYRWWKSWSGSSRDYAKCSEMAGRWAKAATWVHFFKRN